MKDTLASIIGGSIAAFGLIVALGSTHLATPQVASAVTPLDSTFLLYNDTEVAIYEMYMSWSDDRSWGPQLLRSVLYPGDSVTLYDIPCDIYDVRIVDEDGIPCELYDIELCFDDADWHLTDRELLACQGW